MKAIVRHDDLVRDAGPIRGAYSEAVGGEQTEVAAYLRAALALIDLAAEAAARDQLRANHAMSREARQAAARSRLRGLLI